MKYKKVEKFFVIIFFIAILISFITCAKEKEKQLNVYSLSWEEIEKQAKGADVFFSAWGGSEQINAYIQWAAKQLLHRHGIMLHHMFNNGGIEAMQIVQREKAISKKNSSLDLMWINGAAFRLGHEEDLLSKKIYSLVPNTKYINENNPTLFEDFTIPTNGDEVPWGTAQLIYFLRANKVFPQEKNTATSITTYKQLFNHIKNNKNRFTYPQPPDFTGLTFIKSLFYVFSEENNRNTYYSPYNENNVLHKNLINNNDVWNVLRDIHPHLWRDGKTFPKNYADLDRLYKDGEIDFGMTFNPFTPQSNVALGNYFEDTQTFLPEQGSIANAHFLAIPNNSANKAAALVVINFFLSPEAQARKSDIQFWGDPTVLDIKKLSDEQKILFTNTAQSEMPYSQPPKNVGKNVIREFHASWEKQIENKWLELFN